MKPTELRLTNYVNLINRSHEVHLPSDIVYKVLEIGVFNSEVLQHDINPASVETWIKIPNTDLAPIPLTEEWLKRFGFEWKLNNWYQLKYWSEHELCIIDYNLSSARTSMHEHETEFAYPAYAKGVKYVHQLQNLYFALTGEELTLTNTETQGG